MKNHSPQNLQQYFHLANTNLSNILVKVNQLAKLQQHIDSYLNTNLRSYCLVANQVGHKLVLIAANGAVATALRFQQNDLLAQCQQQLASHQIKTIEIKVRPFSKLNPFLAENNAATHQPMSPLSPQSVETIKAMTETIKDAKLKAAMERIAQHGRKK